MVSWKDDVERPVGPRAPFAHSPVLTHEISIESPPCRLPAISPVVDTVAAARIAVGQIFLGEPVDAASDPYGPVPPWLSVASLAHQGCVASAPL